MPRFTPHPLILAATLAALPLTPVAISAAQAAPAVSYSTVQATQSRLSFVFKQMNVPVEGKFNRFAAQIDFNPAKPEAGHAAFTVDIASIDAGSAEANGEVVGKNWFNAKVFPQAKFASTAIKALGGNRYQVTGNLTIKGRSRPVTAPFTFTPQGAQGAFDGGFVLKRADFGLGEGEWADFSTVANEIQIKVHLLAGSSPAKK